MWRMLFCKFNPKRSFPRRGPNVVSSKSLPPAQCLAHSSCLVNFHWIGCLWAEVKNIKEIWKWVTEYRRCLKWGKRGREPGRTPSMVAMRGLSRVSLIKKVSTVNSTGWHLGFKIALGFFLFYILKILSNTFLFDSTHSKQCLMTHLSAVCRVYVTAHLSRIKQRLPLLIGIWPLNKSCFMQNCDFLVSDTNSSLWVCVCTVMWLLTVCRRCLYVCCFIMKDTTQDQANGRGSWEEDND